MSDHSEAILTKCSVLNSWPIGSRFKPLQLWGFFLLSLSLVEWSWFKSLTQTFWFPLKMLSCSSSGKTILIRTKVTKNVLAVLSWVQIPTQTQFFHQASLYIYFWSLIILFYFRRPNKKGPETWGFVTYYCPFYMTSCLMRSCNFTRICLINVKEAKFAASAKLLKLPKLAELSQTFFRNDELVQTFSESSFSREYSYYTFTSYLKCRPTAKSSKSNHNYVYLWLYLKLIL